MEIQRQLANGLLEAHPAAAASVLETIAVTDAAELLAETTPEIAAAVVHRIAPYRAAAVLAHFDAMTAAAVISALSVDVAAGLLRRMEPAAQAAILAELSSEKSRACSTLLRFAPGTAGALMDPLALALPEDVTAHEAMRRVRESPAHAHYNLYIVDRTHVLVGVINLRELLLAGPRQTLASVMNQRVFVLPAAADRRSIIEHPGWHEVHSLPVVGEGGILLGAIRYRSLRLLEDELRGSTADNASSTARALGDLFWTGVAGLIGAVGAAVTTPTTTAPAAATTTPAAGSVDHEE